jgi:hypothetical protein
MPAWLFMAQVSTQGWSWHILTQPTKVAHDGLLPQVATWDSQQPPEPCSSIPHVLQSALSVPPSEHVALGPPLHTVPHAPGLVPPSPNPQRIKALKSSTPLGWLEPQACAQASSLQAPIQSLSAMHSVLFPQAVASWVQHPI